MDIFTNYFAVFFAAIASFAIGAFWYSPLGFGKPWMTMLGMSPEGMKDMRLSPIQAMSLGFIGGLITSYVLAHFVFLFAPGDWVGALQLGFWIWLGFQAPILFGSFLWENRPLKLFLINGSYQLVTLLVMSLILTLWK